MNTRTKLAIAFILLLFVVEIAVILSASQQIENERDLSYRMGFMQGCQSYALRTRETGNEHTLKESHVDCSTMLLFHEHERGTVHEIKP